MSDCNDCNKSNSFICGKNNCPYICCPSCIIKHYKSCCYKVKVLKNTMPKDVELDDKRGHPYYIYKPYDNH